MDNPTDPPCVQILEGKRSESSRHETWNSAKISLLRIEFKTRKVPLHGLHIPNQRELVTVPEGYNFRSPDPDVAGTLLVPNSTRVEQHVWPDVICFFFVAAYGRYRPALSS